MSASCRESIDEKAAAMPVTFVTMMPSPYQVELFDELERQGRCKPFVIYLKGSLRGRLWKRPDFQHDFLILDEQPGAHALAWRQIMKAPLVVFAYYTHPFALAAMHVRAFIGSPWAYWGERPGFLKLGIAGRWLRRLLLRPLRRSHTPVWGIGEFALDGYRKELGEQRPYANVPYSLNLEAYLKVPRSLADSSRRGVRFLFSGALIRRKGVQLLARVFLRLAQEFDDVELLVMGDGPLRKSLAKELAPVAERVRWLGFVDWKNLSQGYRQADVLCVPSRYDGWGLVVVEGLAAGMPVIATRETGAARELIESGRNGWLIDADNETELLTAMREAATKGRQALTAMGDAARKSARNQHIQQGAERVADAAASALGAEWVVMRPTSQTPVRVMLVGNYLPDRQYSMQRYAHLLEQGLHEQGVEVTTMRPAAGVIRLARPGSLAAKWLGFVDKFAWFSLELWSQARWHCRQDRSLIHILDQGNGFYVPLIRQLPHVLTCHDLIAVRVGTGNVSDRRLSLYQRYNRHALGLAGRVACVSEATRRDCLEALKLPAADCVVIPNSLDPVFANQEPMVRPQNLPQRYWLHVGSGAWYKNREGLLRIYHEMRGLGNEWPLVLLGEPLNAVETSLVHRLALTGHVKCVSHPGDEQVRAAYQHAEALIFPSLCEGFGWPILEALAQGTAVFTTNREPMTEVGGIAARYIEPDRPREAAEEILRGVSEIRQDGGHVDRCRAQVAKFSQQIFLDRYLKLYEEVLSEASMRHPS